ncbi:MAG: peptidoglycan DD-metalloendopeptidase family protein [Solirubrobacterales bacterium]
MKLHNKLLKNGKYLAVLAVSILMLILGAASARAAAFGTDTLGLGSEGVYVSELQHDLTALGYDTYGIDGKYGGNTKNAVIEFQKSNYLAQDGLVGPKTKDVITYLVGAKDQIEGYKRVEYVVENGDTLWVIANRYKTTIEDTRYKNQLTSDWLTIGQHLMVRMPKATVYTPPKPTAPPSRGENKVSTFWKDRSSWLQPLKGKQTISQEELAKYFGNYRSNSDGSARSHAAIDYIAKPGTPVYAMTDGRVINYNTNTFYAGTGVVEVENADGSVARYAEIRPSAAISSGQQWVRRGELIGTVIANTTASRSAMLHLEMYYGYDPGGKKITGPLTEDNSNYYYVSYNRDAGPYYRRADLINPTGSIYLPTY